MTRKPDNNQTEAKGRMQGDGREKHRAMWTGGHLGGNPGSSSMPGTLG